MLRPILTTVVFLTLFAHIRAQYLMSQGGVHNVCSATFYDSGGSTGDYQTYEDFVITFCNPTATGCISVNFDSFSIEGSYDFLYVYEGPDTTGPLLKTFTGNYIPSGFGSSNTNCLTFHFTSDNIITALGWEANLTCNTCPTCNDGIQNGTETGIDCGGNFCTPCPGKDCTNPIDIGTLPFSSGNRSTEGSERDYVLYDICPETYTDGEDVVFVYNALADTCITVSVTNVNQNFGIYAFENCPSDNNVTCIDSRFSTMPTSLSDIQINAGSNYSFAIASYSMMYAVNFILNINEHNCPTCSDGIQNGDEQGIDCGGSLCPQCPPGVQDCEGAHLIYHYNSYVEPNNYNGTGVVIDEINPGISCQSSGEHNNKYYRFTADGLLDSICFSIIPNGSEDYDWAVYDMTGKTCTDMYNDATMEIACNYNGSNGMTGPNGLPGGANAPCIPVIQGNDYLIYVSRYSSGNTPGYILEFSEINGMNENLENKIQVFPNPAKNILHFLPVINTSFQILDLGGRIIDQGMSQNQILIDHLLPGIYIFTLSNEISRTVVKVVIYE